MKLSHDIIIYIYINSMILDRQKAPALVKRWKEKVNNSEA